MKRRILLSKTGFVYLNKLENDLYEVEDINGNIYTYEFYQIRSVESEYFKSLSLINLNKVKSYINDDNFNVDYHFEFDVENIFVKYSDEYADFSTNIKDLITNNISTFSNALLKVLYSILIVVNKINENKNIIFDDVIMGNLRNAFLGDTKSTIVKFGEHIRKYNDFRLFEKFLYAKSRDYYNESSIEMKQRLILNYEPFKDHIRGFLSCFYKNSTQYKNLMKLSNPNDKENRFLNVVINNKYNEVISSFDALNSFYYEYSYLLQLVTKKFTFEFFKEQLANIDKMRFRFYSQFILDFITEEDIYKCLDYLIENKFIFTISLELIKKANIKDLKYLKYIYVYEYEVGEVNKILNKLGEVSPEHFGDLLLILYKTSRFHRRFLNAANQKLITKYNLNKCKNYDFYKNLLDALSFRDVRDKKIVNDYDDFIELFNSFTYFTSLECNEDLYNINVNVYCADILIARFKVGTSYIEILENRLDTSYGFKNLYKLYSYMMHNNISDIKTLEDNSEQELLKYKERKRIEAAKTTFENFAVKFDNDSASLMKKELVDVEVYLSEYYEDIVEIKIKIGINKYYIVKSFDDLALNLDNNILVKYGKELEFYHTYQAFNEKSRNVLEFLLSNKVYRRNGTRHFISNTVLFNLLKILKNQVVYFNDKQYLVTLEEKNINFYVDDNYNFKITDIDLTNLYMINESKYIIFENNEINYISDNNAKYLDLAISLDNLNIKEIKDEFYNNVFVRIPDKITISDKIKDEFTTSNLDIKLYFDYNDIITVKNDYYLDEKKVDYDNLDYISKQKVNIVNNILINIGVVDNRIEDSYLIREFFFMDFSELRKYADVFLSDRITRMKVSSFIKPQIQFKHRDNSLVDVFLDDIRYSEEELKEIFKALKKKIKFIKLDNDNILTFNDDDFEFYNNCRDLNLKYQNVETIPLYDIIKYRFNSKLKLDNYIKSMMYDLNNYEEIELDLSKINATLKDYQIKGVKWLKTLEKYNFGGILADEMGLGKTLQVIAFLAARKSTKANLIVCPKSLIYNWCNEFDKFAGFMKVVPIVGTKEEREKITNNLDSNTNYIISYDTLRNDKLEDKEFDYLILDEAQAIKNHQAIRSERIRNIKANTRLCLTGTPIENSLEDIWSLFLFLMPGFFKNLHDFNDEFENDFDKLNKKIAPFILRRTKKEVLSELPDKYEEIISTEISADERKIYEALRLEASKFLNEKGSLMKIFTYLTRLRQVCVSPKLFVDNYKGRSSKIDTLINILKEAKENSNKVLVFSQFVSAFPIIEERLKSLNINCDLITGKTSSLKRTQIVDNFNASNKINVLLISLKAGGTGLNLTSADTVIHLDPWWNVAVENQATDRAHRIGQTKNVHVIKLICDDTIEQRVLTLQNKKKELFDAVVDHKDDSMSILSEDDIKFILS